MTSTDPNGAGAPPFLGAEGAASLALALLAIAASGGLGLLVAMLRVAREGWAAPVAPECLGPGMRILVLGQRLAADGRPGPAYRARLDRAARLHAAAPGTAIALLGGPTRAGGPSEAAAGRAVLRATGVAEAAILTEDRSRHTLENLICYRARFAPPAGALLLVTSRVHLARARRMAEGLGLDALPCAGESARSAALRPLLLAREGFLLHWYVVGRWFAERTANRTMLARIR